MFEKLKDHSRSLLRQEQIETLKEISADDLGEIYIFYKPADYVSGFSANFSKPEGLSLRDYFVELGLDREYPPDEMIAFGRLDKDTSGLLVLAKRRRFPRFMDQLLLNPLWKKESVLTSKIYRANVKGLIDKTELSKIKTIKIPTKNEMLIEVTVESVRLISVEQRERKNASSVVEIEIHEGKHHQVKKMFYAMKHPVLKGGLHRIKFAMLTLGEMKTGQIRKLLPKEKEQLVKLYNEWLAAERTRFNI